MNSFTIIMLLSAGFFLALTIMRAITQRDFSSKGQLIFALAGFLTTAGFGLYPMLYLTSGLAIVVCTFTLIAGAVLGLRWTDKVESKHMDK